MELINIKGNLVNLGNVVRVQKATLYEPVIGGIKVLRFTTLTSNFFDIEFENEKERDDAFAVLNKLYNRSNNNNL